MHLVAGGFIMWLGQYIPVLFPSRRAENQQRNPAEKAIAVPLARCARVPRATAPCGRSSWQGGSFAPRCIPRSRSFAPCTSPDVLRLLDFRPGRFHQPLDPRPLGDFALPPDPHRPGVCRHGPARGLCAHRPQRGFRAPAPRPTVRPVGCASPHATAWGYCLSVFCDAERWINLKIHAGARQL